MSRTSSSRERVARAKLSPGAPVRATGDEAYSFLATRPLHVLVFVLPLLVVYEIGSVLYLHDRQRGIMETIGARSLLAQFFELFGGVSIHLPAILLTIVLVLWHVFSRDRTRVRPGVIVAMGAESVLWTLPLLILGVLMFQGAGGSGAPGAAGVSGTGASGTGFSGAALAGVAQDTLEQMPWQARLTLSIGAGIYEELVFRLILVTLVHMVIVDVMRLSRIAGVVMAAIVSAIAFAVYHDAAFRGGLQVPMIAFYAFAGLYFAVLYLLRGFGIVVGTHAFYDVLVLVVIAGSR
ncbi:MAG: CPBP family intramembrane glutamic endopeptidase [Planctomycetota bacterium]|nr:CPBP family intramembrane glutamic endopeptidase [Planctomycetota bacterium]